MYDSAKQLHATGNFGRALLAPPTEPQQVKHERRVCHFPLQAGRSVGFRRRRCRPRAGTVYQRGGHHSGCADRTYSGGRKRIQNHLLGKTLSRLHRPIRLDSNRIRRQLVSLARAENGRMVVSRPSSNISKALPKKSSCRRPLKGREKTVRPVDRLFDNNRCAPSIRSIVGLDVPALMNLGGLRTGRCVTAITHRGELFQRRFGPLP